ncbi:NRDE family protein [Vicingus serpentipes]|uniref:NRDE family protein n=1 Tax=Vicingus serpentipes TaxID=1926625 RepID=A0A5C6RSC0_9FLAO|nr:NRDE family protein [Vicingus serpentipes]TXB64844.1 NRDE family protein [Vicingus serpentipes]
MCTVTFFPIENGYVLTSSRDEKKHRPTLPPQSYSINGEDLIFPKDEEAGGTWIVTDKSNRTVCLLNGAFENHIKQAHHTKSRGLIVLESFSFLNFPEFASKVELENVEPFTLLLIDNNSALNFTELRWDGIQKHICEIDVTVPKIWSSATLYSKEIRKQRENWFEQLLKINTKLTAQELLNFHLSKHDNGSINDLVMERENGLQTISVSQIIENKAKKQFYYKDLTAQEEHTILISEKQFT